MLSSCNLSTCPRKPTRSPVRRPSSRDSRRARTMTTTPPRPVFVYSMSARGTAFKNFFEPGELKKIIENPGQFRPSGWDLITRDRARIVKGQYFEVSSAERKRIRVYQDGSVIVRVYGDEDFLSWGQNKNNFQQSPRVNTIALIEFTLN